MPRRYDGPDPGRIRISVGGTIEHVDTETRSYRTGDEDRVLDLTRDCAEYASGRGDGLLHVFVPHATAGIAILETGAGSDDDLLAALRDLLPADDRWRHQHGTPVMAGRT